VSQNPCAVLDASALLAYLQGEPGSDRLADILVQGAVISAINWAETLSKLAERGQDPDMIITQLIDLGVLNNALSIYSVLGKSKFERSGGSDSIIYVLGRGDRARYGSGDLPSSFC